MLRINPAAPPGYYLDAAGEVDRPGPWAGRLSASLGLEGVDLAGFKAVANGRTPDGATLTRYNRRDRRYGVDATFSEPKSVSIMEQVAGDTRIGEARRESIYEVAVELIEPLACCRETGVFGTRRVMTGNLACKLFDHLRTRPENGVSDPNGHGHLFLANATEWKGKRHALEMLPIKEAAPFLEAAWHARFAEKLKGLGYGIRPTRTAFEIAGVPDAMIHKFSSRTAKVEASQAQREQVLSEQIREAASTEELHRLEGKLARVKSPKGKAALGAMIREKKTQSLPLSQYPSVWMERLNGGDRQTLQAVLTDAARGPKPMERAKEGEHLARVMAAHMRLYSRTPERAVLTDTLKAGVGEVTLAGIQERLAQAELVRARVNGVEMLQTWENRQKEREVLQFAKRGGILWITGKPTSDTTDDAAWRAGKDPYWMKDAGKLPFADLHRAVQEAEQQGCKLVLQGLPPKNAPEGHPLRVLRDVAGLRPLDDKPIPKRPKVISVVPSLKGFGKKMRTHWERMRCLTYRDRIMAEQNHVRREASVVRRPERGIER